MSRNLKKILLLSALFIVIITQSALLSKDSLLQKEGSKKMIYDPISSVQLDWNLTIGQNKEGEGRSIVNDSFGNVYVVGTIRQELNDFDIFVAKYNNTGNQLWNNTFGYNSSDFGYDIALDSIGNIYLAGCVENETNPSDRDVCVVKYNNAGYYQWNETYGNDTEIDIAYGIAVDSSDKIYVAGSLERVNNGEDVILLKYDNTGALEWQKNWSASNNEAALDVAVDALDNIYLTGYTASFGAGGSDLLLMKYNSSGDLQWNETFGGAEIDEGQKLVLDKESNIYIVGNTRSFGAEQNDVLLLKYNSTGDLQLFTMWGGNNNDFGYGIALDAEYNIYLTGSTQSFGDENGDGCLVKFNNSGSELWNRTWGSAIKADIGYSIALDAGNNIFITGNSSDEIAFLKYSPLPSDFTLSSNAGNPDPDGSFILSWTLSIDAYNYSLYNSSKFITEINSSVLLITKDMTERAYSIYNLKEGTYYFEVVAYNNFGNGTSNCAKVVVQYPPGALYLTSNATNPDYDGTFTLNWSASEYADNYSVYVHNAYFREINNNGTLLAKEITYRNSTLLNLTTGDYYYAIVAKNEAGNNISNCVHVIVRRIPLFFILSSDADDPDADGRFYLNWTHSNFSTSFTIYYSSTFISKINADISILESNLEPEYPLNQYQYKIKDWSDGTYYFVILAENEYGNCSSNCISITIQIPSESGSEEENSSTKQAILIAFPFYLIIFPCLLVLLIWIRKRKR